MAASAFGISTGLILTGGIAALVYAYLVRFLAVALQSVEAGLAKVTPSMDDAARSLGTAPLGILTRVHVPLLAPSLLTAALMVFVDVMKELPATFMMRPFNFDTLAVHAYNLAADERLSELAAPALTIVAAGLVPLVILSRSVVAQRAVAGGAGLENGNYLNPDRSAIFCAVGWLRPTTARLSVSILNLPSDTSSRLSGVTEGTTGHSLLPLAK